MAVGGAGQILKGQVVDKYLSGISAGFSAGDCKADEILPIIRTPVLSVRYIAWNSGAFSAPDTLRGLSAQVKKTDYDYTVLNTTLPAGYAGAVMVDRRVAQQNAGISQLNMAKQKLLLKLADMAREKEKKAATLLTTLGNWSSSAYGNVTNAGVVDSSGNKGWARPDTDIFGDIENALVTIQTNFGTTQNMILVLTRDVWSYFRKNSSLKSYFVNTSAGAAAFSTKEIADLWGLEDIIIPTAIYNSGTLAAPVNTAVWGTNLAMILHRPQAPAGPGPFDPSNLPPAAGWTMQLDRHPYVDTYYDEERTSDVYTNHDNYLHLMTSNIAGYYFQSVGS